MSTEMENDCWLDFYEYNGTVYTEKEAKELGFFESDDCHYFEDCLHIHYAGEWEDVGIGSYEFWGIPGNDVQWVFVVDEITSVVDSEDNEWAGKLSPGAYSAIAEDCAEDAVAHMD